MHQLARYNIELADHAIFDHHGIALGTNPTEVASVHVKTECTSK